jgi:hypothetical protein
MSPQSDGQYRGPGHLSLPRRIGRAALTPFRSLGIEESIAALRQDFADLRASDRRAEASRVKLDETGAFDRDAMAFLQGQRRASFEDRLATRQRATSRNAWISLGLGVLFFAGWLCRLTTMTWTTSATLTALQFTPASAVWFLLAFRFGLENYQIRMRRRVRVMEYLCAAHGFWPR